MPTIKPMLAGSAEESDLNSLRFPLIASPKLDGIRALIIDGVVMSRNLKPIPNAYIQKMFGKKKYNGFDGELIVGEPFGDGVYNRTSSGVMSEDGEPDVTYFIFDIYSRKSTYNDCLDTLEKLDIGEGVRVHEFKVVKDIPALLRYEEQCLEDGYEGLILRSMDGEYKFGRSSLKQQGMLKFKRFLDDEGEIVGFEEEMSNQNEKQTNELGRTKRSSHKDGMVPKGTLGAFKCVTVSKNKYWAKGVDFDIGSGFTAEQRADLWKRRNSLVGKIVKFKYFPVGIKDRPRFPIFLGFRDKRDM